MNTFYDLYKQKEYEESDEEKLITIHDIIGTMNDDEIDAFGVWLYTEFFEVNKEDLKYIFSISEVRRMVAQLEPSDYDKILDFIDPSDKFIDFGYFTNDGTIDLDDDSDIDREDGDDEYYADDPDAYDEYFDDYDYDDETEPEYYEDDFPYVLDFDQYHYEDDDDDRLAEEYDSMSAKDKILAELVHEAIQELDESNVLSKVLGQEINECLDEPLSFDFVLEHSKDFDEALLEKCCSNEINLINESLGLNESERITAKMILEDIHVLDRLNEGLFDKVKSAVGGDVNKVKNVASKIGQGIGKVGRRLLTKNINRKIKKFAKQGARTWRQFYKNKIKNRPMLRKMKAKMRRYRRIIRNKAKAYKKDWSRKVKKGIHHIKKKFGMAKKKATGRIKRAFKNIHRVFKHIHRVFKHK